MDNSVINVSELKMELEKIASKLPLIFDVELPFRNVASSPDHIRLPSNKKLLWCDTDITEDKVSKTFNLFCRTSSSFNIPVNLRSSEDLTESLRYYRRTRSTNDLGDFNVQCMSVVAPGNVINSPLLQCMYNSMERTVMARSLLKSSLFYQLGTIRSGIRPFRARSFNLSPVKSSTPPSSNSQSGVCSSLTQEPEVEAATPGNEKSESKISKKLLGSCSSTNSAISYQSSPLTKGLLHCVWKNGSPNFAFTVGDDCSKVYLANSRKIVSSDDKILDYLYIFGLRATKKASDFVGKMKVSSSLVIDSNHSKFIETEFVLFGANSDYSREFHGSSSSEVKSKGFSKKIADLFRPSHSTKHKSTCKIGEWTFQIEDFVRDPCLNESSDFIEPDLLENLENDFPPNLQLAAVVVKDKSHDIKRDAAVGGWGLKFLEKVAVDHVSTSVVPTRHYESCEGSNVENRGASRRSMNVLIPSGFHGGPITRTGGPSSLTERWRSGGHCDCGGWDTGCPLTVLQKNTSAASKAFTQTESQEDCKSVELFIEGGKNGESTFKMIYMSEDMYTIYFHSSLSPLQSFSIGVANIHSQTPSLHPNL